MGPWHRPRRTIPSRSATLNLTWTRPSIGTPIRDNPDNNGTFAQPVPGSRTHTLAHHRTDYQPSPHQQGCCFSRSAGPNSPYPGGATTSSAGAINTSNTLNQTDSSQQQHTASPHRSSPRRRRRERPPLDQHINKPLRRHTWTSKDRRWTKRQLAREREDFFDTRVTGRPEVWQTIHAALRVLWEPSGVDDDGTEGLNTAQTILSAAEISLPTGNLSNGVYDALGNYYALPEWIVCDPIDVVDDGDTKVDLSTGGDETAGDDDDDDDLEEDPESRREEKGKGVVDVREQVALRARLSENGRDYHIVVAKSDTVRSVARRLAEEASVRIPQY